MASGGEGSRNLNKENGPLQDLLEHEGDDVSYDDRLYRKFFQIEFGSNLPPSPSPPIIIPDPNLYNPGSPSDEFVAGEKEKAIKSDLFKLHMKKIQLDDGMIKIKYNYCSKTYKTNKSFGYGTHWNHIRKNHPSKLMKASNQSQISRSRFCMCRHMDRQFGSHQYMGVTCNYIDNDRVMQKRIIAFRVFDESHMAQNIFRLFKIIFEEFHIQNKIFVIGFDNAASNTAAIPMLQDLCNPYFMECLQDYLTHYYKSLDLEVDVLSYCNSIKTLLYELYDEYLKVNGPSLNMSISQPQPTSDGTGTSPTFKLKGLGDRLFFQIVKKLRTSFSSSSGSISELDRYLETSHEFFKDSEFSIQVWWKDHEQIVFQFWLLLPNKFWERRFLPLLWNKNLVQVEIF
ncbi:hypothetical protein Dsin_000089 [Dipteronia sinensis]|uniref:Uncharacterized protein n=1 Tax=Dipteronia sinensis TaxID=43782 RepID=A0AAD9ZJX9_9ROSI|nr:hypothetical protein Dsin_000089 [Dipteronia sinensis]